MREDQLDRALRRLATTAGNGVKIDVPHWLFRAVKHSTNPRHSEQLDWLLGEGHPVETDTTPDRWSVRHLRTRVPK